MCDHPNRETAMVTVAEGVWCDPCLAPLVAALNDGGQRTVASCCGHGRRPATVCLADGRVLIVADDLGHEARLCADYPDINASDGATPDRARRVPLTGSPRSSPESESGSG